MPGKVEICGVNTSRLKVLSQQEMTRLLLQVRQGDAQAREQLIEGNLRLVLSVIQRFEKRVILMRPKQLPAARELAASVDPGAFLIVAGVSAVFGEGFKAHNAEEL